MNPAAIPAQLGRYRLLKTLGQGGMGSVYLAEDTVLRRRVALKIPLLSKADGAAVRERFHREARAAAAIDHPNLCPVHDFGEVNGVHYLVMPYIEGTPLSHLIDEDNPWPPTRAAALVRQLALALVVLHQRGLIHRDLKPSNVMLRPNGEPVVMDFGLARSYTEQTRRLTRMGAALGTPPYMAPEQILGDAKAIGPATDIYGLGVILYQLLSGSVPFVGPPAAVYGQILRTQPEPPSMRHPGLDAALDGVCLKALAKKPAERFVSMASLAEALKPWACPVAILADPTSVAPVPKGITEQLPSRISPWAGPTPDRSTATVLRERDRPRGHRTVLMVSLVGLALLALGVVSWVLLREGKGPAPNPSGANHEARLAKELRNSIGMKLVLIPAGKFMMGSPKEEKGRGEEEEQHQVEITQPFYMGATEVTQEQYEKVIGKNPSWFSPTGGGKDRVRGMDTRRFPVEMVSWEEAVAFCKKLSELPEEKRAGRSYRLPTEAQWEYACRGGAKSSRPFHFGDSLSSTQANFNGLFPFGGASKGIYLERPTGVGSYEANAFGLFDMHGNVWEWCADWYGKYPRNGTSLKDPTGPTTGMHRVMRGGCWNNSGLDGGCRSACRLHNLLPRDSGHGGGFRVVCVAIPDARPAARVEGEPRKGTPMQTSKDKPKEKASEPQPMQKTPTAKESIATLNAKLQEFNNWKPLSGTWAVRNGGFIGTGDSVLRFNTNLPPDCVILPRHGRVEGDSHKGSFRRVLFGERGKQTRSVPLWL
jgi:formylglycine-generating enzyme required for sulfatase activity/serine/threonine protein kinase